MWQRRLVALLVLLGIGLMVPSASAQDEPDVLELPSPTRTLSVPETATSVLVKYRPGVGHPSLKPVLDGWVKLPAGGDPGARAAVLRRDPSVEAVTVDHARRATRTPNDQLYYDYQSTYLRLMRLPEAWDRVVDAGSQVIAVIDTGVDLAHPDLAPQLVPGFNAVDPAGPPTDQNGHGTMVAGIAAARTGNSFGIAGVAWTSRIMPVKVFTGDVAFDSDIATGILWAVDHGATIINLSLGGPADSPVLRAAVGYAAAHGVLMVAASGNDPGAGPQYPAAYPEVLAVGSTDWYGRHTAFSTAGDWVDLAAPGFRITSTYRSSSGYLYATGSGTSYAAPLVAGVAALVRAQNPALSAAGVADRLRFSARDAGPPGLDPYFGHGVLDAARAVGDSLGPAIPPLPPHYNEPNDVPARAAPFRPAVNFAGLAAYGQLSVEGNVDWYRYDEPNGGRAITVSIQPPPDDPRFYAQTQDPVLEVYNADLGLVARADNLGSGGLEKVTIKVDVGTYFVKVRNYNASVDTRLLGYEVRLTTTDPLLYDPPQHTTVGNTFPKSVAIGDVTGDGRPDAILGTASYIDPDNDFKLFVFAQQADGSLAAPVRYAPAQPAFTTFAVLDWDRDGRQDLAVAGVDGVEILRQTTAGALVGAGLLPGVAGPVEQVIAADVDGDGDGDLVLGSLTGITLLTHGAGSTFTASAIAADPIQDGELDVGDLDGDGRVDLAAFRSFLSNQAVHVYHQQAGGWVRTTHPIDETESGGVGGIEVADVTGDGRADLVATDSFHHTVLVLAQQPDGALAPRVTYALGYYDLAEPVEAADLDQDGRVDVVVANGPDLAQLNQRADGTLANPGRIVGVGASHVWPQGLALGDVNSDGRNDIVVASHNLGLVVFHNSPQFAATPASAQEFVRTVTPIDQATEVRRPTVPQVGFQVPLDPASVTGETVRLMDGRTGLPVPATLAYDPGAGAVTVTPTAGLGDHMPYRIVVDGVRDAAGRAQPWPFSSTFQTEDTSPPRLVEFLAFGRPGGADLSWVANTGDLDQVIVRMAAGGVAPGAPNAGTPVYAGAGTAVTLTGLTPGTTYSFAAWVQEAGGALSPVRTVTLIGTRLGISVTSGATGGATGSAVTFSGTLAQADSGSPFAGRPVSLVGRCRGGDADFVAGIATTDPVGQLFVTVNQVMPRCYYRWELNRAPSLMGATSAVVEVTASIPNPPGGPPPRQR